MVECGEGLTHYFGTLLRSILQSCIVVTDNNLLEDSLSLSSANFSMNTKVLPKWRIPRTTSKSFTELSRRHGHWF
jgi:hypothetical protein